MAKGRTDKVIKNSRYAVYYKITETVFAFLLRTVFVHTLSTVYLGINGVFVNVLTVLSLMDLGVGAAISFSLYKPLADNDLDKIAVLMALYKKIYNSIGVIVCVVGVSLTPFLKYILTLPEDVPYIYLIYWLNIGNTAITYFLSYKRTILLADQRSHINYKNDIIFKTSRFVLLSAILIFTKNFILYLVADVFNTFCSNISISHKVNKLYPYLKQGSQKELLKEEKQSLLSFMKAGILNKVGQTVVNSTDSIVISAFVSTVIVGFYSNYLLIIGGIETMAYLVFSNITSSVGNLAACATENLENVKRVFQRLQFFAHVVSTVIFVCLLCLINPFIEIWLGAGKLLEQTTVFIIITNLYITMSLNGVFNFISAKGELFYKNRARPLVEAIVNLIVSIVLVKYTSLGINGVFIGTTVSFLVGRVWMDPFTLYKHWFKEPFYKYAFGYLKNGVVTVILSLICFAVTKAILMLLPLNIFVWIGMAVVVVSICVCGLLLIHRNNENLKYYYGLLKNLLHLR